MTIKKSDWDEVRSIATRIANCEDCDSGEYRCLLNEMQEYLQLLESRYGRLPDILSTRADYCDNAKESLALFDEAYRLATEAEDRKNTTLISSSVARKYIEEIEDRTEGHKWLDILEQNLKSYWDEESNGELQYLRSLLSEE